MNDSDKNQLIIADDAAAAPSAVSSNDPQEKPPPYLKLIADCWEHVFDYLSFNDILVIGHTCKRMQQMAGYYVREYYPEYRFVLNDGEIRSTSHFGYFLFYVKSEFYQYISTLKFLTPLNFFLDAETFSALKTLYMRTLTLVTTNQIEELRNVLKNVENLHLLYCEYIDESLEQLIAYCPKLKYLNMFYSDMTNAKSIFLRHCPTLEHFQYERCTPNRNALLKIDELKIFLEKHLKLKHFECNYPFLWENRDVLLQTNVQLELLTVYFEMNDFRITPFDQFQNFLVRLYDRGIYKTLHLSFDSYIIGAGFEDLTNAASALTALQILHVVRSAMINLSHFTNLKELDIGDCDTDMEIVAKRLTKLERLIIRNCSVDHILPFIRYSKRLKSIKVTNLGDNVLDLFALNEERKVNNAEKITLFVNERVYLHVQWKSRNLNLSLVKIERLFD